MTPSATQAYRHNDLRRIDASYSRAADAAQYSEGPLICAIAVAVAGALRGNSLPYDQFPAWMFEIHLTTRPIDAERSNSFVDLCTSLGGKSLVIELSCGTHALQPMATFHVAGSAQQAQAVAEDLTRQFTAAGHAIVRCKIEFDLHDQHTTLPSIQYVEWHGRIDIVDAQLKSLRAVCEQSGAHLSRNPQRHRQHRFATLRAPDAVSLETQVKTLRDHLAAAGWRAERERWEGVSFDSNLQLDQGWI